MLKPNRVGGLLPACRIAHICEAASIGISLDTTPLTRLGDTMNCHLAATLRDPYPIDVEGHLWLEESPFRVASRYETGRRESAIRRGLGSSSMRSRSGKS